MKRLIAFGLLLLLSACSSKPDDALIAQQVSAALLQRHNGAIFEVINLRKVNGIVRNDNRYDAEVAYDLRFRVDLQDAAPLLQQHSGSIFAAGVEATTLGLNYGNFKAGDTLHKQEWVHFVRSEQGWLIDTAKP